jgi:class 3 adenylate cyclase
MGEPKTKLPFNPLTLRFPNELERVFFDDYFEKSLGQVRFALLLVIFFYVVSTILDEWVSPDTRIKLLFLRYAIVCPFLIASFLFTFSRLFKRFMQPTLSLVIFFVVLSFAVFALTTPDLNFLDEPGLIIIILYTYTAIKLMFVYATVVGWIIVVAYNTFASFVIHPSLAALVENNFHLFMANLLGMFANYLMEYYIRRDYFQDRLLAKEREKVERLLLNILPQPIAERLKEEQATIADHFAEATILFADIVGFTQISARISPPEVVDLLNKIFSMFDQLAERHGLEKIKTIGDAYMVAGGLPTPRAEHAEAVAEMALDMQQKIARFNQESNEPISIRIGINTGPVVAGVIGLKKFSYDLWGDAVNTASRMESHGLASCIQVSQATYERLRDKYWLQERGVIYVKGKGEMLTYLLTGRKGHQ